MGGWVSTTESYHCSDFQKCPIIVDHPLENKSWTLFQLKCLPHSSCHQDISDCFHTAPTALLELASTRQLKTNSECLSTLSKTSNLASFFTILAQARNDIHLAVLEAIFITSYQPVLCSQKDHVRCLTLF